MKTATGVAVAMTVLLAGCAGKSDPNEKNFGAAVAHYLEKKGELCLNVSKWPVDVSEMELRLQDSRPSGTANRMAALETAGLAKGDIVEVPATDFSGRPTGKTFTTRRYVLTAAAKPFERQREVSVLSLGGTAKQTQTDLCWGQMVLDKVVKWEGPMKLGDYQEARVDYRYRIDGLAEWSKTPEIRGAFPSVERVSNGAGNQTRQHSVKLTSLGREAKGLDF